MAPPSSRRFITELTNLIGKRVEVVLIDGRKYVGRLLGFEHPEMNLVLSEVKIEDKTIPRVFIMGRVIAEIRAFETTIFDPKEFADYVARKLGLRPDAIRIYPDAGVVMIYNSIRVTAEGVEGAGPLAAKVNYVLREYLDAKKRGEQPR